MKDDTHKDNPSPGIVCDRCGCRHLPVKFTRRVGNLMKRSRECRNCGRRVSTVETSVDRFSGIIENHLE